jgi:hypothetical protein
MDLQEMADRLAIRELAERYAVAVTIRDWEALGACFHPDSRWRVMPWGHEFTGREGIVEGVKKTGGSFDLLVNMIHGVVIDDLTADRARTTVILNEAGKRGEAGIFGFGVYRDIVAKIDGHWRFVERDYQGYYSDSAPLGGEMLVDYAARR